MAFDVGLDQGVGLRIGLLFSSDFLSLSFWKRTEWP